MEKQTLLMLLNHLMTRRHNGGTGILSYTVRGSSVSSLKKRVVKRASLVAPIKLGLKMCVIPWGILIQAY